MFPYLYIYILWSGYCNWIAINCDHLCQDQYGLLEQSFPYETVVAEPVAGSLLAA